MLVIPAIDIRGGNCVRLLQGDPDKETVYSSDPVATALRFQEQGAELIHIVDLDGAFEGRPVNHAIAGEISRALSIPVEIGGGIRDAGSVKMYASMGIKRIIIGTAIFDPGFESVIKEFKDLIVAGVDARDSIAATHGWKESSGKKAVEIIKELQKKGISEYIYTDISTDGMLGGPNIKAMEEILLEVKGIKLIASGGVSSVDDLLELAALSSLGLRGAITGKAVYDGRINLREAILRIKDAQTSFRT